MALSKAARLLKDRTAGTHHRIESGLGLLDPALDVAHLHAVLTRFHGFWGGTEPLFDTWARDNPAFAARLQWARRRRFDRLCRDLAVLTVATGSGSSPAPVSAARTYAPAVFDIAVDEADLLGWLYVAEGSTLGGAVIDRALRRIAGDSYLSLETFTPYAEGPGPMWRAYLAALDEWTADDALRTERVAAAGVRTFDALATWLDPVRRKAAA